MNFAQDMKKSKFSLSFTSGIYYTRKDLKTENILKQEGFIYDYYRGMPEFKWSANFSFKIRPELVFALNTQWGIDKQITGEKVVGTGYGISLIDLLTFNWVPSPYYLYVYHKINYDKNRSFTPQLLYSKTHNGVEYFYGGGISINSYEIEVEGVRSFETNPDNDLINGETYDDFEFKELIKDNKVGFYAQAGVNKYIYPALCLSLGFEVNLVNGTELGPYYLSKSYEIGKYKSPNSFYGLNFGFTFKI